MNYSIIDTSKTKRDIKNINYSLQVNVSNALLLIDDSTVLRFSTVLKEIVE